MRGGGWGRFSGLLVAFLVVVVAVVRRVVVRIGIGPLEVRGFGGGDGVKGRGQMASFRSLPSAPSIRMSPGGAGFGHGRASGGRGSFIFPVFEGP
jgi:hypothetical protein